MATDRLARQIEFIIELDKAKRILRRNRITGDRRRENDAEHAWHMAVMAMALSEYAAAPVDLGHVLQMILLHDVVEIDAGDAFIYDADARAGQAVRERLAADRLFGLLPDDQAGVFRGLWEEFEAGESADARFARSLDRLHPLLLNAQTEGQAWREHGVRAAAVLDVNAAIADGAPDLWTHARAVIRTAVRRGHLDE